MTPLKKLFFIILYFLAPQKNIFTIESANTPASSTTVIFNTNQSQTNDGFTNGLYLSGFNIAILLNNAKFTYKVFTNIKIGHQSDFPMDSQQFGYWTSDPTQPPATYSYFYGTPTTSPLPQTTLNNPPSISIPSTVSALITVNKNPVTNSPIFANGPRIADYSIGYKIHNPNIAFLFKESTKEFLLFNNIEALIRIADRVQNSNAIYFADAPNPYYDSNRKQIRAKKEYYGTILYGPIDALHLIKTRIKENLIYNDTKIWDAYYFKTCDLCLVLYTNGTFLAYSNITKTWLAPAPKSFIAYQANPNSTGLANPDQLDWIYLDGSKTPVSPLSNLFTRPDQLLPCSQTCSTPQNNPDCILCPPSVAYTNAMIIDGLNPTEEGFYESILTITNDSVRQAIILDKKGSTFKVYRSVNPLSTIAEKNNVSLRNGRVKFGQKGNPLYVSTDSSSTSTYLPNIEFWGIPYSLNR